MADKTPRLNQDLLIETQRPLIIAIALVGVLASIGNMVLSPVIPAYGVVEFGLQLTITIILVALIAVLVVARDVHIFKPVVMAAFAVSGLMLLRIYWGMFIGGLAHPPEDSLPLAMPYSCLGLLCAFTFLDRATAIRVGIAILLLTILPMLAYVSLNVEALMQSPRLDAYVQQFVIVNPLIFGFLALITQVQAQMAIISTQQHSSAIRDRRADRIDPESLALSAPSFRSAMRDAIGVLRGKGQEGSLGMLEITATASPILDRTERESYVRRVSQAIQASLPESAILGRLSRDRFAFFVADVELSELLESALELTDAIKAETIAGKYPRGVSLGLVCYRPGEHAGAMLQRAEDQVRRASECTNAVAFDPADIY